ncbi:hypothetical protein PT111_09105, partial [Erysipelothrix rhusiopathiae]|nr:hypothetical protein [Erysipelothrix rhusiopathiae]
YFSRSRSRSTFGRKLNQLSILMVPLPFTLLYHASWLYTVFLIIECVHPTRRDELEKATHHLATFVEQPLEWSVKSTIIDYV